MWWIILKLEDKDGRRVTSLEWKRKGSQRKYILHGKFHNERSVGKPRTRWNVLQIIEMRG